jgi:hypothetical protein
MIDKYFDRLERKSVRNNITPNLEIVLREITKIIISKL